MGKKRNIKIQDLNVDIEELQKKNPQILKKIRGGRKSYQPQLLDSVYAGECETYPWIGSSCPGPFPGTRTYICPKPPSPTF